MADNEPMLCKYAYKQCQNTRAQKKDGTLHRLCLAHREKANSVQKVYATRRRRERRALRRQNLVERLLGNVEPVPFNPETVQVEDPMTGLVGEWRELLIDESTDEDDVQSGVDDVVP